MAEIKIPKDIFARDKYGVKRRVFVAGQVVEGYVINAILRSNEVLNPEDLGVALKNTEDTKVFSLQTKTLSDNSPTLKEQDEEPKKKTRGKKKVE